MVTYDEKDRFFIARQMMMQQHLRGRDIRDMRVLNAMEEVPREAFVPQRYAANAYDDNPLPIGMGQTISQPYIVALMTQALHLTGTEEVLEIGTGCGYQAAILAKLAGKVYTVERIPELSEMAQAILGRLGFSNIEFYIGDGSGGWPQQRTFDRIILTAAVQEIPKPLTDQLKEGGWIVAPVGGEWMQDLIVGQKSRGALLIQIVTGCRFVRMIGKYGYDEAP
ncbi:MAG: protein-L-isoaspartate(D-aspartate) O-methyltransferase [Planctomycetaceae bacterium]|nr:protein-L-isoaspartate(D-aspartate) O-methyltransferase [Planctomycetaceae bacterium]